MSSTAITRRGMIAGAAAAAALTASVAVADEAAAPAFDEEHDVVVIGAGLAGCTAAIFAAEVYGIPMPLDRQLTVILLAVLASIGSMGVPSAALIMITMVFTQVGIPLEAIALVAGVDRIMDMARTTINVLGDATGALFVSKLESDFDPERGERLAAAE